MAEKTLTDEIITIIQSVANNNPAPTRCKIIKIYTDNIHADIETETGTIRYVETISNNLSVGNIGVLIYLDGDINNPMVITK